MRSVRVVAAVIRREERVLISLRRPNDERGGQWEFPGGKVEAEEAEPEALVREIREELGCEVMVGSLICRHRHRYQDLEVTLAFYACRLPGGSEPRCLGSAKIEWAPAGSLSDYDFCEADRAVLGMIARNVNLGLSP